MISREEKNARRREYYHSHKEENREKNNAARRKWYHNHIEEQRARRRRYYYTHTEVERAKERRRREHPRRCYYEYKSGAKRRKLSFNLTFKEFTTFWQQPCYYCGENIKTIGLDRVDNSLGYSLNNVVPCCTKCNRMKMKEDRTSFIERCSKIALRCSTYKSIDISDTQV